MSQPNWEDVNVPRGAYFGWGDTIGQSLVGKVLSFDPTGGTDANDQVCPQVTIELTEEASSFSKKGGWETFATGELVVLNCGLVSLKRAVRAADPTPGDLVKISLENLVKVPKGIVKEIGIRIARMGGRGVPAQSAPTFATQPPAQPAQPAPPFAQPAAPLAAPTAMPPFLQ